MSTAIELMHVLADAATAHARRPASGNVPGVNAGMTFTMLRGVEPLPPGPVEKRLLVEHVQALFNAARQHGAMVQDALRRASDSLPGHPG